MRTFDFPKARISIAEIEKATARTSRTDIDYGVSDITRVEAQAAAPVETQEKGETSETKGKEKTRRKKKEA